MFDFQFPSIITVIDHLMGHATVDADVLAGDEAGLVGTEEQHHVGYVHRITDTSSRLLCGIGAIIDGGMTHQMIYHGDNGWKLEI